MGQQRILIYRLGSIGDFVVALPSLHLVRARFPTAEIGLLTNRPIESRAAPAASILDGTKLVDRYLVYPSGDYRMSTVMQVTRDIRSFDADLLVYLTERTAAWKVYRDHVFFRCCGIRDFVGLPFTADFRRCRPDVETGFWEPEAQRLVRCIAALGIADYQRATGWDLHLSEAEIAEADGIFAQEAVGAHQDMRLLGVSTGTKQPVNDWGNSNWRAALAGLGASLADFALILIGAAEDRERSQRLAESWPGLAFNLCGRLSPRLSAAVLRRADALLCHDSGPMHLAGAVGTRCIAVFSNKDPPGKWFPFGNSHIIIRPPSRTGSIRDIEPSRVVAAVNRSLGATGRGIHQKRGKSASL